MARYPRHPFVWLALGVLLLNDHVLKGSGLLPGAITGKLSDFAWLLVAPVFAASLLRLRTVEARAALLTAFVGLFVVTELSQGIADGIAALATELGLPSRLWADPTDLIALSVLPLTWHVMTHVATESAGSSTARRGMNAALGRMAMGLGIFASVATTNPPRNPTWTTGGYVVNRSGAPIDVRVRWTSAQIDCETLATADLTRAVSGVIFDEAITYRLLENETVPLERADPAAPSAPPILTGQCQLALVAVDGASDLIVFVPADTMTVRATQDAAALDVPERAVTITLRAPGYDLTSALHSGVRDDRLFLTDCSVRPALATSAPWRGGVRTVVERIEGADGCTTLVFSDGERAFLCVPSELVPFVVGDTFSNLSSGPSARFESETHALVVVSLSDATTASSLVVGPFTVALLSPEPCEGIRSACGAYTQPYSVRVTGGEPTAADRFATTGGARLAIGRAERRVIAHPGCDYEHTSLGVSLQYAALLPL